MAKREVREIEVFGRRLVFRRTAGVWRAIATTCLAGVLIAGGCARSNPQDLEELCTGFPDWETSPYILPYPVGAAYLVDQGNCSPPGNGHRGASRYGYDFLMPIGTRVTAARAGVVLLVEESHVDGEIAATGKDNYVYVLHDDGTSALYGHFTKLGVAVEVGQAIAAGTLLGLSGNTGNTGNKPHLHLSVFTCNPIALGSAACPTAPFTFRNTDPNPSGLQRGRTYEAR